VRRVTIEVDEWVLQEAAAALDIVQTDPLVTMLLR